MPAPPAPHLADFLPAVLAGFGLLLVGGANLLLLRRGPLGRAAATLAVLGLTVGAAAALDQPGLPAAAARLLALGLVPCLLLGSRRVTAGAAAAVAGANRPAVRFGLLAAAGVAVVVASVAVLERAEERAAGLPLDDEECLRPREATVPAGRPAATDRGTPVTLKEPARVREGVDLGGAEGKVLRTARLDGQVIRRGPPDERANCHGWVFAAGRFYLSPDDVELVLAENGYREVRDPQPGDLAVYRQGGKVAHTAVVRYAAGGQPVLVEGKWGTLGVFLHPPDKSVYGTEYTFHRSARPGHLLAGLGGPAPSGEPRPAAAAE